MGPITSVPEVITGVGAFDDIFLGSGAGPGTDMIAVLLWSPLWLALCWLADNCLGFTPLFARFKHCGLWPSWSDSAQVMGWWLGSECWGASGAVFQCGGLCSQRLPPSRVLWPVSPGHLPGAGTLSRWLLSALERLKGLKDGRGCGLDRANGLPRTGDIGAGVGGRGCFPLEKSRSASWKRWHFTGVVSCWWTSGHERGSQNSGWPAYAGRSAPAERVTCAVSFISCKCGHRRRAESLQSCPTLRSHGLSPPRSSVHGIFQDYWSGSFPRPGDLLNSGTEPRSPALQADSLPSEPPGKPTCGHYPHLFI